MPDETHIRWDYEGKPDPLMGTGATRAERSLVWIAGLGVAGLLCRHLPNGAAGLAMVASRTARPALGIKRGGYYSGQRLKPRLRS